MDGMGQRLRELRGDRRQAEIAKALGIGNSSYTMYENDQREPNYTLLCKIAEFYGVSTDYLLGRTECKSPDVEVQAACERYGLSERALDILKFSNEMKEEGALVPNFYFCRLIDFLIKNMQCEDACNAFEALEAIKKAINKEKERPPRFISWSSLVKDHIHGGSMTIPLYRAKEVYAQMISNNVLNILLGNYPTLPDEEEF